MFWSPQRGEISIDLPREILLKKNNFEISYEKSKEKILEKTNSQKTGFNFENFKQGQRT